MRPADLTLDLLGRGERATLRVQGRSMWPTLIEGDRVVIAPRDEYQVGDLLAFDVGKPSLTVHRLLQKDEGRLRTRGDGMEYVDPWLEPDQVAGVVVRVERGWRSALYNRWFQPKTLGAWRRRWRRRIDDAKSWSLLGNAVYLTYRTLLRPFAPSVRIIISTPAEPRLVEWAPSYRVQHGFFEAWREELAVTGLPLPRYADETTYGVVVYDEVRAVACAWTSHWEPGYANLHDSYVVPSHRRQGLSRALADWVIDFRAPETTLVAALQAHNTASRTKNRAAGFVDVGYELRLRLWPLRNVWTRRFARPGCKHLVDAWARNADAKARR